MKFIKPTLEEIKQQFQLKDVTDTLEAEQFYAYYESKGWIVGKSPMRSWRAAVAGWILRVKKYNNLKQQNNDKFSEEAVRARMARW